MSDQFEPILVWEFHNAPEVLQKLSDNGGDEDWLAVCPPRFTENRNRFTVIPDWMTYGENFGCADVSEYKHPTKPGYVVVIGSHA